MAITTYTAGATSLSGVVPVANGGTNSSAALSNNRIAVTSSGGIVEAAALTNGQVLIGSTGAAPVAASLTAGTNITLTPGAGSLSIAASGGGGNFDAVSVDVADTTFAAARARYVFLSTDNKDYVLPASPTTGDVVFVSNSTGVANTVAPNTGQLIRDRSGNDSGTLTLATAMAYKLIFTGTDWVALGFVIGWP